MFCVTEAAPDNLSERRWRAACIYPTCIRRIKALPSFCWSASSPDGSHRSSWRNAVHGEIWNGDRWRCHRRGDRRLYRELAGASAWRSLWNRARARQSERHGRRYRPALAGSFNPARLKETSASDGRPAVASSFSRALSRPHATNRPARMYGGAVFAFLGWRLGFASI